MARNTLIYTVTDDNRDKGKTFFLTEMPASQAESWAMRALLALLANNADLPEGLEHAGMAGMAEIGIKALSGLKWEIAEPLLNEMWECVEVIPDPSKPHIKMRMLHGGEVIEEISTRIKLRAEVWKLHTAFLQAVAHLEDTAAAKPKKRITPTI